jgi:hypothetical protein
VGEWAREGGREGMNELNLVKELLDGRGQGRELHHESKVAGGRPRREAQEGVELEIWNKGNEKYYKILKNSDDLPRGESEKASVAF